MEVLQQKMGQIPSHWYRTVQRISEEKDWRRAIGNICYEWLGELEHCFPVNFVLPWKVDHLKAFNSRS